MLKLKTALKLTPSVRDDEYDRRKREMKSLGSALRGYKGAMEKAKVSIRNVIEAFVEARMAFEALSDHVDMPDCTKNCTLALAASVDRITAAGLREFNAAMDLAVLPATLEVKNLYDECRKLDEHRNRIMHEYDVYHREVTKKEIEYQRKLKDLSTSRSYSLTVAKRNRLESNLEAADREFRDAHDQLMHTCAITCTKALNAYVDCTARFMKGTFMELEGLKSSSEHALQVVRDGSHAEYDYHHG